MLDELHEFLLYIDNSVIKNTDTLFNELPYKRTIQYTQNNIEYKIKVEKKIYNTTLRKKITYRNSIVFNSIKNLTPNILYNNIYQGVISVAISKIVIGDKIRIYLGDTIIIEITNEKPIL